MKKSVLSLLLTLILVSGLVPQKGLALSASELGNNENPNGTISYLNRIVDEYNFVTTVSETIDQAIPISEEDTVWGTEGEDTWYVLQENLMLKFRPEVRGTVHLILINGKTLTANSGITVERKKRNGNHQ